MSLAGSNGSEAARPVGNVLRISREGTLDQKNHYKSFNYEGKTYEIEETVLLTPESQMVKPYVAIIKDITMNRKQRLMLSAQLFYRPEDIEREEFEDLYGTGARELFLSFHKIEVAAEAAMHKCVVHVLLKQYPLPPRKLYPGFIAQEVYDPNSKRLFKLSHQDFEHDMLQDINLLAQKTLCRLGVYPYFKRGGDISDEEDQAE